jgi:UDP-glucose 4-epimerase
MPGMVDLVAGGAGFIGRNLIARLLAEGREVVCADRAPHAGGERLTAIEADLSTEAGCARAFEAAAARGSLDEVWHLAANSDIPSGVADPVIDMRDTFLTTFEILRAMRRHGARRLIFASSSAIYGDHGEAPIKETTGPLFPISNYGAMKLASEAQATAAAQAHLDRLALCRFPNVVGVPATHGVILDLVRKLKADPERLDVLGDGSQRKAYLHVDDLVAAMLVVRDCSSARVAAFNIGPLDSGVTVGWIAESVVARVSPGARIMLGQGDRGWIGDVPKFSYLTEKIQALGWAPALGSQAAVLRAIDEIALQEGV